MTPPSMLKVVFGLPRLMTESVYVPPKRSIVPDFIVKAEPFFIETAPARQVFVTVWPFSSS